MVRVLLDSYLTYILVSVSLLTLRFHWPSPTPHAWTVPLGNLMHWSTLPIAKPVESFYPVVGTAKLISFDLFTVLWEKEGGGELYFYLRYGLKTVVDFRFWYSQVFDQPPFTCSSRSDRITGLSYWEFSWFYSVSPTNRPRSHHYKA
jgi:hypothetical protein